MREMELEEDVSMEMMNDKSTREQHRRERSAHLARMHVVHVMRESQLLKDETLSRVDIQVNINDVPFDEVLINNHF